MLNDYELGYTPNNLKTIRHQHNLTQSQLADLLGVKVRVVMRWESDVSVKTHADMSHKRWLELLSILGVKK